MRDHRELDGVDDVCEVAQSEQRRSRIGVLFGLLQATLGSADARAMPLLTERLKLMEEEEMKEDWNTLFSAACYYERVGDKRQARQWAARAAESAKQGLGSDSDEFKHYAARAK